MKTTMPILMFFGFLSVDALAEWFIFKHTGEFSVMHGFVAATIWMILFGAWYFVFKRGK